MDTLLALVLLILVGFAVLTAGIVTIEIKVIKIQNTINEFYEINKKFGEVNDTLISVGKEGNKASLDICEHIKEVIALNTELIRVAKDSLDSLKTKH